jgi:hypothetical protein
MWSWGDGSPDGKASSLVRLLGPSRRTAPNRSPTTTAAKMDGSITAALMDDREVIALFVHYLDEWSSVFSARIK